MDELTRQRLRARMESMKRANRKCSPGDTCGASVLCPSDFYQQQAANTYYVRRLQQAADHIRECEEAEEGIEASRGEVVASREEATTPTSPRLPNPWAFPNVGDAQEHLEERLEEGVECPCCGQHAQVYYRRMYASVTLCLIRLVQRYEQVGDYIHVSTLGQPGGDYAKAAYWGLCERAPNDRPDAKSSGRWRPTPKGVQFVYGKVTIPRVARVYDGKVIGFDGPEIDVKDALGKKFNYAELMLGGAAPDLTDEDGEE